MVEKLFQAVMIILIALSVVVMFSSCGQNGLQIVAYDVENGTFFQDAVRDYYKNNNTVTEDSPYFALSSSFSMDSEDFIKNFLQRYDSNFGLDLKILVTNRSDRTLTVNGIRTDRNGYEDTYISSLVGLKNSVTIGPDAETEITVHFLGNGGIYTNEEFLEVVLKEMDIKLSCTFDDTGEEKLLGVKIKPAE